MTTDFSFLQLILEASIVVQAVMALLVAASVFSWFIIVKKRRTISSAVGIADEFEATFWSGGDLSSMYQDLTRQSGSPQGMSGIFEAGFREFRRLRGQEGIAPDKLVEGARRSMRVTQTREVERLEQGLANLATIGSTSPYVGLFGTVWGIMNSFSALGAGTQTATLTAVAPGIAEALVATAMGLFAAIPAVIFYNRYADQVGRLESRYETFVEEFLTILERHAHRAAKGGQ
ncbi:protein TolQ [Lentisalinibacter salinarum]|uniref:protein TolQ n=1 Tax=Lentisalinibacter salinarum TaxID=2992239 RepID=UPI00386F113C